MVKKFLSTKPAVDYRDGERVLKSRIGLKSKAVVLEQGETLREKVKNLDLYDVTITDKSQFFTENQVGVLRLLADNGSIASRVPSQN